MPTAPRRYRTRRRPDTPEPLGTFPNEAQTFYLQVYAFNEVSLYGSPNERNVLNVLPIFPPTFTIRAQNFITLARQIIFQIWLPSRSSFCLPGAAQLLGTSNRELL